MKPLLCALLLALASSAYGEIYTWKDKRGTEFFTNSLYEIPERYRSRARLLDVATGKRLPIGSAPAAAPPAGQAAGQPAPTQATQAPIAVQPSPNQPAGAQAPVYQPSLGGQPGAAVASPPGAVPGGAQLQRPGAPGQMPRVPRRSQRRPMPVQNNGEGE